MLASIHWDPISYGVPVLRHQVRDPSNSSLQSWETLPAHQKEWTEWTKWPLNPITVQWPRLAAWPSSCDGSGLSGVGINVIGVSGHLVHSFWWAGRVSHDCSELLDGSLTCCLSTGMAMVDMRKNQSWIWWTFSTKKQLEGFKLGE
jgi:hypothetical protein